MLRPLIFTRPEDLVQQLLDNRIDLIISPDYHDEAPTDIETRCLGKESVDLVVRAGHPLAKHEMVMFADVERWPIATTSHFRWPGDPGLFICDNYFIMRDLVRDSDLVWICAREFVEEDIAQGRMVALSVPDAPEPLDPTDVVLGRLKGRACSRLEREVIDFFENRLGEGGRIRTDK